MKGKVRSIVASLAILMLVVTLAPLANSESAMAAPSSGAWEVMPIPSAVGQVLLPGSTIVDFDVAGDGTTVYALTGLGAGARIAKSVNGGRLWSYVNEPAGWTAPGILIRVAPDDPETVAVVDSGASPHVYLYNTTTGAWEDLGDPVLSATGAADASAVISDLEVSLTVATNELKRDILVCTYNADNCQPGAGGAWGDIYMVGPTRTWASQAIAAGTNYDWTSIALSSNWVGQRAVVGVGSDNVAAGNAEVGATGDTYFAAFNVNPTVGPLIIAPTPVNMDTGTYDSPCEITAGALNGEIVSSSVSLPDDFDSASVAQFQSYIGWTSVQSGGIITNGDDAYRVDFNLARKLQIASSVAIYSVDYSGTVASGKLYAGETHKATAAAPIGVWFTSSPTSGLPTWEFSYKPPTSTATANTNCKVLASPAGGSVVFGGCATGPDTAFSISEDGGVSFNGIGLVDDAIDAMPDVMPTPAGEYLFLATANLTSNNQSLWRCAGVPATGTWERVGFVTPTTFTAATSIIRISPYWADDQTVYWVGTAGGTNILKSSNNGQIWVTRTAGAANVVDVAVESAEILYMIAGGAAGAATNVYASTNGGWSWGLPNNPGLGNLLDIAMAPDYPKPPVEGHVLVGAIDGFAALSTASATIGSFIPLLPPLPVGGNVQVCADKGYADNNIIYAGSSNGKVYQYAVGWEEINSTIAAVSGLVTDCGCLCASDATPGSGADRMGCGPPYHLVNGLSGGETFDREPNALRLAYTDAENQLYAIDTANNVLYGYTDIKEVKLPFVYSIKFICGRGSESLGVQSANYATAINIHNFHDEEVVLQKKAVIAHREDEPAGMVSRTNRVTLGPNMAIEVDCVDIYGLLDLPYYRHFLWWKCPTRLFIKGFVVIESTQPLNIEAVYTAKMGWGWCRGGLSIDVEQISPVVSP
jgi:hypothetical protein